MTELDRKAFATNTEAKTIGPRWLDSAALARLIEEVRNPGEAAEEASAYNRTYHRHNR